MKRLKGFTLVELVITIAVVIILSVVSAPIYQGYVYNAKISEAYALLGTILSAQKAYYAQYGYFFDKNDPSATGYMPELGIDARGNKYFTRFRACSGENVSSYYFHASLWKPADLVKNQYNQFRLWYNITSGSTVGEI